MSSLMGWGPKIHDAPGVWAVALVLLLSAASVALGRSDRRSIVALWVAELGAGAMLLFSGAETMALVTWISGTAVCGMGFAHADLFGAQKPEKTPLLRVAAEKAFPAAISAAFGLLTAALLFGAQQRLEMSPPPASAVSPGAQDERFVLIELLALFAIISVVGGATISRARRSRAS
jgi:hypothetical protein